MGKPHELLLKASGEERTLDSTELEHPSSEAAEVVAELKVPAAGLPHNRGPYWRDEQG